MSIRMGLIGAGRMGKVFAHTLAFTVAEVELLAVADVNPQASQKAAAAGKHIFSEKPLALTLEACDQAIAAVEKAGVNLQLGFMRRFDPAYRMAKKRIEAGEIGTPVMFCSTSRDPNRTSLEFARRENRGGLICDVPIAGYGRARFRPGALADGQRGSARPQRGRLPGLPRIGRGRRYRAGYGVR